MTLGARARAAGARLPAQPAAGRAASTRSNRSPSTGRSMRRPCKTRAGIDDFERARPRKRVVTTGCGQGSVFGDLMDEIDAIRLPPQRSGRTHHAGTLYAHASTRCGSARAPYKSAGSVHGCALFRGRRDADVRRGRRAATTRSTPSPAGCGMQRRRRRRQGLLHDRPADQRDGDEVGADGRADRRLAQRHHADGARARRHASG